MRFGATVNDVIHDLTVDLVERMGRYRMHPSGSISSQASPSISLSKPPRDAWLPRNRLRMQGIGAEVVERTTVGFNLHGPRV